jgi:hypothetical protein
MQFGTHIFGELCSADQRAGRLSLAFVSLNCFVEIPDSLGDGMPSAHFRVQWRESCGLGRKQQKSSGLAQNLLCLCNYLVAV